MMSRMRLPEDSKWSVNSVRTIRHGPFCMRGAVGLRAGMATLATQLESRSVVHAFVNNALGRELGALKLKTGHSVPR